MNRAHNNPARVAWLLALSAVLATMAGTAGAQQTHYGETPPSVDDIIQGLSVEGEAPTVPGTRALRPGSAVSATAETAPAPAPAPVAAPARPASISMQINFDFNSDSISPSSRTTMDNLAQALGSAELASRQFLIIGHTDAKGSAEYNQRLSERRAVSVRNYLVRNGVPAERLEAVGRGKSQLLDGVDPDAAENRRVEIQARG